MKITSYIKTIERKKLKCEVIIVMQHGKIIAEHRWIPEKARNVFSVSKSFTSIAIGMAIDKGKMSLDDKVIEVLPENPKPDKKLSKLTLRHLLTMTRGHKEFSRPQTVVEALAQPLSYKPGSRFVYDNGSTFLASAMFTKQMEMTVLDYLTANLFRPLGIKSPKWAKSSDGHTIGATGLFLKTSDMAVFGQFLLQRGKWEGNQLVSANWIDNAGRPQINTNIRKIPDWDVGYGYFFWPCRHGAYRCDGRDGQYIIVIPSKDAVIAINSNEPNMEPILNAVWDKILPKFKNQK